MSEAEFRPRNFAFALGTFHACAVEVVVLLVNLSQGSGDRSGTAWDAAWALVTFGLLWAISIYATGRALRRVHTHRFGVALQAGVRGGMLAAWLVVGLLMLGVMSAFLAGGLAGVGFQKLALASPILFQGMLLVALGLLLVGTILGGAIGFLFAIVDWFILQAAGIRADWAPSETANAAYGASTEVSDD